MSDFPIRKRNRLKPFIYIQNGAYSITICTQDMRCLFGVITESGMHLSEIGAVVEKCIHQLDQTYADVDVLSHVIMPNHVHMIIALGGDESPSISRIINQFKGAATKQIGKPIWQKSFFDHVIRNERSYQHIWRYIENNPKQWLLDEYHPK